MYRNTNEDLSSLRPDALRAPASSTEGPDVLGDEWEPMETTEKPNDNQTETKVKQNNQLVSKTPNKYRDRVPLEPGSRVKFFLAGILLDGVISTVTTPTSTLNVVTVEHGLSRPEVPCFDVYAWPAEKALLLSELAYQRDTLVAMYSNIEAEE